MGNDGHCSFREELARRTFDGRQPVSASAVGIRQVERSSVDTAVGRRLSNARPHRAIHAVTRDA